MNPVFIMLAALFPVAVLLPCQIFAVLKATKPVLKLIPGFICFLILVFSWIILPENGVLRLLTFLYGILLLILCGIGWVIAYSVLKSQRK